MSKKSKVLLGYVIAWILLLVYLGVSNKIVYMTIPEEQLLRKVNIEEYTTTSEPVICLDESLEYIGGTYEYAYCGGWAFCETDYNNDDKVISVIFRNLESNVSYACDSIPQLRQDVYDTFKSTKRIYNGNASVECKFSTLNLPFGTYEMLINVFENEYDYGIISTSQYYEKSSAGFWKVDVDGNKVTLLDEVIVDEIKEVSLTLENVVEQGNWYIDNVEITEDSIKVLGWASYSKETNNSQTIYVALNYLDGLTKYYTTQEMSRKDVANHFDDESYTVCGFTTTISTQEIEEIYSLSIIAEINGKYYPIALNGKILSENNNSKNESLGISVSDKKEEVEVILSQEEEAGVAYIDKVSFENGVLKVKGWASYSPETNEEQCVYIGLTGMDGITTYYKTKQCSRKDVSASKGEAYEFCGYEIEIEQDATEIEYTVSIVIQVGDNFYPINIKNSRVIRQSAE